MRVRILGSFELEGAHGTATLAGGRSAQLLALLVANVNRPMGVEALKDALWECEAGAHPDSTVRAYVAGARRALREADPDLRAAAIETCPGGYRLRLADDTLDADEFERRVAVARSERAAGRAEPAADELERALGLWRGEPFAGLPLPWLDRSVRPRLESLRLAAATELMRLALDLGRHAEVLPELEGLVGAHPLNEELLALLMRALHESGRAAESLDAYQRGRDELVAETGLSPGEELEETQRRVLRGARRPRLAAASPTFSSTGSRVPESRVADSRIRTRLAREERPRELPLRVPAFIGRDEVLEALERHCLAALKEEGRRGPVVVVSGPPAVGKTAFAVEAAHRIAAHFPDGQLHLPWAEGDSLEQHLRSSLEALGLDPAADDGPGALERRFRRATAGLRLLMLIDGRPEPGTLPRLLASGTLSATVVAVPGRPPTLTGALPLALDGLNDDEAGRLLHRTLGGAMPAPQVVGRVAEHCDRLPGVVEAAAWHAASVPGLTLERLLERLDADPSAIGRLDLGGRTVRELATDALESCEPFERALLAALVRAGAGPWSAEGAAAATGTTTPWVADALDALRVRGLVRAACQGDAFVVTSLARSALHPGRGGLFAVTGRQLAGVRRASGPLR